MRRARLPLLALLAVFGGAAPALAAGPAARSQAAWDHVPASQAKSAAARQGAPLVRPRRFAAFTLDRAALKDVLGAAPRGGTAAARRAPLEVAVPNPSGGYDRFTIATAPVLAPALQAAHPEIQTYSGTGVDDPRATVQLDLTPLGFHASVLSAGRTYYVDPRFVDRSQYVAYDRADAGEDPYAGFQERDFASIAQARTPGGVADVADANGAAVTLRTYRLALVSDPSYAQAPAVAGNVTAAKATLVARVTQLYQRDLAIRLQLIAQNDQLNLDTSAKATGANGPCGLTPCFTATELSSCGDDTLDANTSATGRIVGLANFDVGHIVLGNDGGGIAGLGVVGGPDKATGCTGLPNPTGDPFAVDYVAHELGHEFGADHTFNAEGGSCGGGNRNPSTSVEPGSGSTIMAYAGICGADDLQAHSDPYFSEASIAQIGGYVSGSQNQPGAGGNVQTVTANRAPDVSTPAGFTIPARTPFTLTASGSDADGDPLTYLWEQTDPGGSAGTSLFSPSKPDGPLFRVFGTADSAYGNAAGPSPSRDFPDVAQVMADDTNAATGSCPNATDVPCFSEFLPTVARTLRFRVTARDGNPAGGGVGGADTTLTVAAGAGPFRLTSLTGGTTPAPADGQLPLTWSVAGTNAAPVNAANVRILLSTDGGATFPTVLAASTPNDGSQTVPLPANVTTSNGRIRIEAVGNVFFDVSRGALSLTPRSVSLSAPATDLGTVQTGRTGSDVTVTVTNGGSGTAHLGTTSLTGADAADVVKPGALDRCSGAAVGAGASCSVTLRLAPSRPGSFAATLQVPSDDPASPLSVALTGTGTAPPPPPPPPPAATTTTSTTTPATTTTPTSTTATTTTSAGGGTTTTPTGGGAGGTTTPSRAQDDGAALGLAGTLLRPLSPSLVGRLGDARVYAAGSARSLGRTVPSRRVGAAVCLRGPCVLSVQAVLRTKDRYGLTTSRRIALPKLVLGGTSARPITVRLGAVDRLRVRRSRSATLELRVTRSGVTVRRVFTLRVG